MSLHPRNLGRSMLLRTTPVRCWSGVYALERAIYLICAGGIFLGKSRGTHVERRENHRRETIGSTPDIRGTRKLYLVYIIIGKKEHRGGGGGFNKMQRTNSRIQANLLAGSFLIFSVNDNGEHVFAPWMAEYGAGLISTRTIQHLHKLQRE
ncbi:predicted protein [Histoplasma capsulatum G186AR]|uniref:Uncharacterized protein n=1 Tax=Ajellomyces capsulatus (strain G186AR / H82 / ATCC MYA-2454 / RMSCC 2432) TaxID=447093 RepID=C0NBS9_AJECG|nr:uncharacterized protein HCBG_00575 [Histoplasma capsulatum G186AR]EEH11120.1 predicted protein [Histoplasma capsulatum G186AR]